MASDISISINTICLLLFALTVTANAQNITCPFKFICYVGDGAFDTGNAVRRFPFGPTLPATRSPYGRTFPGRPAGRWSDGRLFIEFGAQALGFPQVTPYLSPNSSSANAVTFATARSPVLDLLFFTLRSIIVPPYVTSLRDQINWLKTSADQLNRVPNSLFVFGDIEGNDITYALRQGKSIQEVASYITFIIQAQINALREVIKMGATRILITGNAPMGCYPFILTKLASTNPSDYDEIGCLKSVNDLIVIKNNNLQQAIQNVRQEFPNVAIAYVDVYNTERSLIRETTIANRSIALQACCGIGGRYNFDDRRFCGSLGVPACSDPNKYFFWDGIHLTQGANNRLITPLLQAALPTIGCTTS